MTQTTEGLTAMHPRRRSAGPGIGSAVMALTFALVGIAPRPCSADAEESGNPQDVIRSAAAEVLKVVKDQPVSVGQITPTGLPDANGGPAIGELLKAEL